MVNSQTQTQVVAFGRDNVERLRQVVTELGPHSDRIRGRLKSRDHLPSGQKARRALGVASSPSLGQMRPVT